MIPVSPRLSYHGFIYTQVLRGTRSCLYQQTLNKKTLGYEVFKIRIQHETTLDDKVYQERERFPKNEDFGKTAWTYLALDLAMERFKELEKR
jgi:hypothetical protein